MNFVNINISGIVVTPNTGVMAGVRVIVKDSTGATVVDDVADLGVGSALATYPTRLDNGTYAISAQAQNEHGTAYGPLLTLSGVVVTDDQSGFPSFVPMGIAVV